MIPDVHYSAHSSFWNIKLCTDFAHLQGCTSLLLLASYQACRQHVPNMWWAPLFLACWQGHMHNSRSSCTKKRSDLHVEGMSKSWWVERNWTIPLSESAKWFKSRNKKMLWRSYNFNTGKVLQRVIIIMLRLNSFLTVRRWVCPLAKPGHSFLEST